ncbi:MAG TPA: 4-hydroxy-tetrahydrodipicolinate reductase [Sphingomicrobium sp.]|jgi:4-hydroxy-tetrahydrodipicolinate reductase|nr:4-hydroxy-tetrahydrodipicolinate reductase [Sphingomicrobium sp.]
MRTADQPVRISLFAPEGRMGKAIANAVAEDDRFAIDQDHGDVLVDFSAPDGLKASLDRAVSAGIPILVGTTGLKPEHHAAIAEAAKSIAVIHAPNTSLGINLLRDLVEKATARLGPDWDIEILEMHHRHKVDAPSGTALMLGQAAAKGRGATVQELSRFDRISEHPHAREPGSIGYASLRGGSVAGEHVVILAADGERIELGHRADSRKIFARGALAAARFLAGRPAGLYTMQDVIGSL